ncbi:DUF1501 domain-containing protein [Orrella sp. JC864]|uniref:DUF1501 domain-containing protein n=1 Tax=Orrella sp. JC864 TaxID=3120298 RepID=UPI00300BD818
MNRRDLLRLLAATSVCAIGGKLYAAPTETKLLVVFLRGAYDAASLLVPVESDFYYESRPNIAIAPPGKGQRSALPLDDGWGLHPALSKSLLPLYERKQLVFVPFAGSQNTSRSHFETQMIMELGEAKDREAINTGFMNRLAQALSSRKERPVSFTSNLPTIFRGDLQVPNVALSDSQNRYSNRQTQALREMYAASDLGNEVEEGLRLMGDAGQGLRKEMREANGNAISTSALDRQIGRVAQLMREEFSVGFLDIGGWDTHVAQGGATGVLASRFSQLGNGLRHFAEQMGPHWDNTVVIVLSEFGRTFHENGSKGTDHGRGTNYWVLGGKVNGGRLAGEQTQLSDKTLVDKRDYPVLNEYRSVLGGMFQKMYSLNADQLASIFPGSRPVDLAIL